MNELFTAGLIYVAGKYIFNKAAEKAFDKIVVVSKNQVSKIFYKKEEFSEYDIIEIDTEDRRLIKITSLIEIIKDL